MDFKDLLKKSEKDLHDMLKSFREQIRTLRFSIGSDQEKNVRKLRLVKKDIAKILTILNKKIEKPENEEAEERKNEEIKKSRDADSKKAK